MRRAPDLRLLALVAPVSLAGVGSTLMAAATLAGAAASGRTWVLLAALLAASIAVERHPVPIRGTSGGVSLAAVFVVATGGLYGWAPAALAGAITRGSVDLVLRRGFSRFAYNASVYALSGAATGAASALAARGGGVGWLLLQVLAGSAAFYGTNVVLIAAVVSRSSHEPLRRAFTNAASATVVGFAIMASVTVMLEVLWQRSPVLAAVLVGPLLAILMYQRSVHRALEAMELALTDPLTGLGNQRHFEEQLQRQLDRAEDGGTPISICLLDLDDFKGINDTYGHPVGDATLKAVGSCLRHGGEGFRLGGDEFALLLPGVDAVVGFEIASRVVERISAVEFQPGLSLGVSAGIATYPAPAVERTELVRLADDALYAAKAAGKNMLCAHRQGALGIPDPLEREETERRSRLRAAAGLARALELRHAETGTHSHAVGALAARLAARLGLSADEVELVRLAGSLHDLGKLTITEEILGKPGPLDEGERALLRRHPRVAYRMLSSLGIEPVATWVLHSHERWDGTGYPTRIAGEEIPLGSRIVFVADAYDAMTWDRPYRRKRTHAEAVAELERCAGTQFDPHVVAALAAELAEDASTAA